MSHSRGIPKAELHLHIEGTLEPEMMLDLAARNGHELPFVGIEALRAAYDFVDLQSFLDIYYQGAAVLQTPEDFYLMTLAYFEKAAEHGVRRAEIFFDPQAHTARGVSFDVFMEGFRAAMADARSRHGISSDLILCFLRHLGSDAALSTMREAEPHLEGVIAVGLDSTERGIPPRLFLEAYDHARELGLRTVAHAGEEGPPGYVTEALDVLGVERIDHGVRSLEDEDLVARLARDDVPLTVCPLSNVALKVVDHISEHPLPLMIEAGLNVSANSDDPAYFGGYVGDNYQALVDGLGLEAGHLIEVARNSVRSSFLDDSEKATLLVEIEEWSVS